MIIEVHSVQELIDAIDKLKFNQCLLINAKTLDFTEFWSIIQYNICKGFKEIRSFSLQIFKDYANKRIKIIYNQSISYNIRLYKNCHLYFKKSGKMNNYSQPPRQSLDTIISYGKAKMESGVVTAHYYLLKERGNPPIRFMALGTPSLVCHVQLDLIKALKPDSVP